MRCTYEFQLCTMKGVRMLFRKTPRKTEPAESGLTPEDYESMARDLLEKAKLESKKPRPVSLVKEKKTAKQKAAEEVWFVAFEDKHYEADFLRLVSWVQHLAPELGLKASTGGFADGYLPFSRA